MIEVTDRAKAELKNILTSHVDYPLACLRITTNEQGQIGLSIDVEMPGDEVVEYQGSKLLVIKQEIASELEDVIIDVEDKDDGKQLVIIDKEK